MSYLWGFSPMACVCGWTSAIPYPRYGGVVFGLGFLKKKNLKINTPPEGTSKSSMYMSPCGREDTGMAVGRGDIHARWEMVERQEM